MSYENKNSKEILNLNNLCNQDKRLHKNNKKDPEEPSFATLVFLIIAIFISLIRLYFVFKYRESFIEPFENFLTIYYTENNKLQLKSEEEQFGVREEKNNTFFFVRGIIENKMLFLKLKFKNPKSEQVLSLFLDTGSSRVVLDTTLIPEPLSNMMKNYYFGNRTDLSLCSGLYNQLFNEQVNYEDRSYNTATGYLTVFYGNGRLQFDVVSHAIISINTSYDTLFANNKRNSILGVGFRFGDFYTNSFFKSSVEHLKSVHRKKVPKLFSLIFEDKKFSAYIGKNIRKYNWFSLNLKKAMSHNVIEVKAMTINNTKTNENSFFVLFDTGANVTAIEEGFFDSFITALKKACSEVSGEVKIEQNNNSNLQYKVCSKTKILNVSIILETDKIKITFPLESFLAFNPTKEEFCGIFYSQKHYTIIGCPCLIKCFDMYLDGDFNKIGFRKHKNADELCSIEYTTD